MDINSLLEQKREKVKAAEEIRTRVYSADGGDGEWQGDDENKFDTLMADAEKLQAQIDRCARLESHQRSLEEATQPNERRTSSMLSTPASSGRAPGRATSEDRALALQGWMAGGSLDTQEVITERHREAAARCGVNLESRQFRLRLPQRAPRNFAEIDALEQRQREQRVVTVAVESPTDEGGILTVPDEMMAPLERALLSFGGMRRVATVRRTNTGADWPIPMNDDTSNTGAILAEGVEHTALDPSFTQLILQAYKYTSRRVGVSVEYLQDNAIDAVSVIGEMLGERIGRITNTHFTTGTGSAQPNGVVTAATDSAVTLASETAPTYRELMDIKHSVDPAYRERGAVWMFNDTMLKEIKKIIIPQFSGDTAGMPLWRQGMIMGEPDTIDGDRYIINQDMPTADVESPVAGEKAILYGDFSKYWIRDVRDITLVRLNERYAELGVVAFLAFSRHDGDLLNAGTGPVKYATSG